MAMDGADRNPSHVHTDSINTGSHDTDSMVTVPLTSNSEHTQPDWRTLEIPQTPVDVTSPTQEHSGETDSKTTPTQEPPRVDLAPSPNCDDASSIRSRSSAERDRKDDAVDWEELEKTEEQEPRCEGSDEVRDII